MFKLAVFTVCLLAAVANAELAEETLSELGLETSNDQEKAQLSGDLQAFGDFCIQTRDYVTNDIKQNANDFSARVYSFFFDNGEIMGRDLLAITKEGTSRLGTQLANPDAPIAEANNEIEKIYADAQKKIQEVQTQPRALLEAFKANVAAISQNVKNQVTEGLNSLSQLASVDKLVQGLKNGCAKVAKYEAEIKTQFEDYKAQIADKSESLAKVNFADVPCATARRVSQAEGLCRLVNVAKGPLEKLYKTRN